MRDLWVEVGVGWRERWGEREKERGGEKKRE